MRRSHTILIDTKKVASVPVQQPPPHVSVPLLPSPVKKPENLEDLTHRTRNQAIAQPLTAINNFLRTGQPQPQNFMFISEEDLQ